MGLYEGIKDIAKVVQQADNIELYLNLLDLGSQALDMQAEIIRLREENDVLKHKVYLKTNIIRHKGIYLTLKDDTDKLPYCATCYGKDEKLIQMFDYTENEFRCPACKMVASIDKH